VAFVIQSIIGCKICWCVKYSLWKGERLPETSTNLEPFSENLFGNCSFGHHSDKILSTSSSILLPALSFETPALQIHPTKFSTRTIRLLSQHIACLHFESLHEQIYKSSEFLASDM
jgi:hypothetical protein